MASDTPPEREAMELISSSRARPGRAVAAIRLAARGGKARISVVAGKRLRGGRTHSVGAVIYPIGLNALLPDWRKDGAPVETQVASDRFYYLWAGGKLRIPNFVMPPLMSNHGKYIVSLSNLCRWLGEKAESLGVEIYPGFAATELIADSDGAVMGVATGDMGIGRDGKPGPEFTRGMELHGKYVLIAEGARGSLTKQLVQRFELDKDREPQKYGLGIKELWEVRPDKHQPGLVQHTIGWPLNDKTGGGSFMYHYGNNLVAVGFVLHLNYSNPYLSPFWEFQRFKTHPAIAPVFEGGKRLSYGARALTEGGWQSVPKLAFPGGALIGCAAGFMNVPRIKRNAVVGHPGGGGGVRGYGLPRGRCERDCGAYKNSAIHHDLYRVRNVKPLLSRLGTVLGTMVGGAVMWLNTLIPSALGTFRHGKPDYAGLKTAAECQPIAYPKPDGVLTFDITSSLYLSGTNHEEDQPVHLRLTDPALPVRDNLPVYAEPAQRYCPAGVYEVVTQDGQPRFQINAQNCLHCKTCDIKDPAQNITWVPPQGGGGPNYSGM
jgi:electron-transferring-flavoprotein dehydrogenase